MEMSTAACFYGHENGVQHVRAWRVVEGQSWFSEPSNNRVIMDTGASGIDLAIWLFPIKCEAAVALYLLKSLECIWGESFSHVLLSPHPKYAALLSKDREGQWCPGDRSPTKKKNCLLPQGKAMRFVFQCLTWGHGGEPAKQEANMKAVEGCQANRFGTLSLRQLSTTGFLLQKGSSFKEGVFNSQLVGF